MADISLHPGVNAGGDSLFLGNAPTSLGVVAGFNAADPTVPPLEVVNAAAPPFNVLVNGQPVTTGGPYAPAGATFITVASEGGLPNSRSLAAGTRLALSDGGAGGAITVAVDATTNSQLASSFITATVNSLAGGRRLAAGARVALTDNGVGSTIDVSVDAATDLFLTQLENATPVTVNGGGGVPNARILTAGSGISITDNGAGSTVVIASTAGVLTKVVVAKTSLDPPGSYMVPLNAISPVMIAAAGGGGGAGGNQVGVGGPGGCGGASLIQNVRPGDVISWGLIGIGGAGTPGAAAPSAAGNGGDTFVGMNNSDYLQLKGGQGGLNVYVDGSFYARPGITPDNPVVLPGQRYPWGFNGGYPNAAGGGLGVDGAKGVDVFVRGGGGNGGSGAGSGGGGGGGGSGLAKGGDGGNGAVAPATQATPGVAGTLGSGGGGGGGGDAFTLPPQGGLTGGAGIVSVEYYILV